MSALDALLLIGLAHWIVWTILAISPGIDEGERDKKYSIGLVGLVVALGALVYKTFLG